MTTKTESRWSGVLYGVAAYGWWGLVAAYFKIVDAVAPAEILAHRIIWSVVILVVLVTATARWPAIKAIVTSRSLLLRLALSTALIALNWFVFIWAITHERMLEASLGYFINPLISVLLGAIVLRERLRTLEKVSVILAASGVLWLTLGAGAFPLISLTLAVSFALYGLVRKLAGVGSIEGLTVETLLLLPLALGYVVYLRSAGLLAFGSESRTLDLLLIAAGPVTALPLLWFAAAVSRLRLATVGLLQYISPTIQLVMAVAVFGETLTRARLAAFVLIWIAVLVYSADNARQRA